MSGILLRNIVSGDRLCDITIKGRKAIKEAACVFSRVKLWFKTEVLADKFPEVSDYAALDSLIANKVLDAEKQSGNVVYCPIR